MKQLPSILEREVWEFTLAGQRFRIVEFSGVELRHYLRRLDNLQDKARSLAREASIPDCGEAVLMEEDAFFARVLGCTEDWVREQLTYSIRLKILAGIDTLNGIEEQMGNWQGLLDLEAAARKILGLNSATPPQLDTAQPPT